MLDHEEFARIIYADQFWDSKNHVVKTAAFSEAESCGMSVTRLGHASDDMLRRQVRARIDAKPGRTFVKLVKATMAALKGIECEGRRAFCCYDTPVAGNPAHAEVCQAHPPDRKSVRAELRRELQKRFADHEWQLGDLDAAPRDKTTVTGNT